MSNENNKKNAHSFRHDCDSSTISKAIKNIQMIDGPKCSSSDAESYVTIHNQVFFGEFRFFPKNCQKWTEISTDCNPNHLEYTRN